MYTHLYRALSDERAAQESRTVLPPHPIPSRLGLAMRSTFVSRHKPNYWIKSVWSSVYDIIVTGPKKLTSTGSNASFSFIGNATREKWEE